MCNLSAMWCTTLLNIVFCIQSMDRIMNYTYIAKAFLCQAVLKYFIWMICFALYMIYIDCWSTHSPYSTQRFHLRETCCFICIVCWSFLLIFFEISENSSQRRKLAVFSFPPCLICLKLWIRVPSFYLLCTQFFL